jgi:hypothetical protein
MSLSMKLSTRRAILQSLCLGGLAHGVSSVVHAHEGATARSQPRRFTVFDGLLYKPMPDLRELGMPKLLAIGGTWRPGVPHDQVDPLGIADALHFIQRFSRDCYFDLEEWTVYGDPADLDARIERHVRTAEIARQVTPELRFGFYGVVPTAPYWPILLNKTDQLATWHNITRRSRVIAEKVDYLFPSLYTAYDDPKGWEISARAVLKEARQYDKPVYPFLWPEFHDSNPKLKFQPIPREFWRRQLEVCRECADGLVLWGGYNELWDEEAPWWLETKSFVGSLPNQQPQPAAARLSRT